MSNQDDKQERAQLERLNEELSEALDRCRSLLGEARSKLAANVNTFDDPQSSAETSVTTDLTG